MDLCEAGQPENIPRTEPDWDWDCKVVVRAGYDPVLNTDHRVVRNLRVLEKASPVLHFGHVQTDVQPSMRKILVIWMFQV